jgi:hypothetical protein
VIEFTADSEQHANYWVAKYRLEALVALQDLISNTMKQEIFKSNALSPVITIRMRMNR